MSRSARRYYRTLFLGIAAMGTLVWAAIDQFDIPAAQMLEFFLVAVLATLVVIALAAVCVAIWLGGRRLMRLSKRQSPRD